MSANEGLNKGGGDRFGSCAFVSLGTGLFRQEVNHSLQKQCRRFQYSYGIKNGGRKFLGQPQRFAFTPSHESVLATEQDVQFQRVIHPEKQRNKDGIVRIRKYKKSTNDESASSASSSSLVASRESLSADRSSHGWHDSVNEKRPSHAHAHASHQLVDDGCSVATPPLVPTGSRLRVTRFGKTPKNDIRRRTYELIEPACGPHMGSPEERFKRKQGPGALQPLHKQQKRHREIVKTRARNRKAKGFQNHRRILAEYDRASKKQQDRLQSRIQNIYSTRRKFGNYVDTDHKSRFSNEFPHVGPQVRTVLRKTPNYRLGEQYKYCVRFDNIGLRKEIPAQMKKEYSSVFWKSGAKGVIDQKVQIPNQHDKIESACSMSRESVVASLKRDQTLRSPKKRRQQITPTYVDV